MEGEKRHLRAHALQDLAEFHSPFALAKLLKCGEERIHPRSYRRGNQFASLLSRLALLPVRATTPDIEAGAIQAF